VELFSDVYFVSVLADTHAEEPYDTLDCFLHSLEGDLERLDYFGGLDISSYRVPDFFKLAGGKRIVSDVVSHSQVHFFQVVVLLVRAKLVMAVNIYFSYMNLELLRDFGSREWCFAFFFAEDSINVLLLTILNTLFLRQ